MFAPPIARTNVPTSTADAAKRRAHSTRPSPAAPNDRAMPPLLPFAARALAPGDPDGAERDERAAAHVTRVRSPQLQRACACGGACPTCRAEQDTAGVAVLQKRQRGAHAPSPAAVPPIVGDVLRAPGHPLDAATRAFMEPRFGHDFSRVRVHTDAHAAELARAVNALAYTVGRDVVFAHGHYAPAAPGGRHLLAHELAHVVQQSGAAAEAHAALRIGAPDDAFERQAAAAGLGRAPLSAAPRGVQRACHASGLGTPSPDCTPSTAGVGGWQFLFKVGCDDLLPGEEAKLSKLKAGSRLNIHGFASSEGPAAFNTDLSCHRANRIAALAATARPECPVAGTFKHGASPVAAPGLVPDPNPPAFWRSVIIEEMHGAPEPPAPKSSCGPDATDWLIQQMVAAKKNANVLKVRDHIDVANFFAPRIAPSAHLDAMDMLEGQELNMIAKAWAAAGKPHATPEANMQLGEPSATFGVAELTVAETAAMGANTDAVTTLFALRDAAIGWRDLVGTKKPYDFKNDPATMGDPKSAHCPDPDCAKTITLCPGAPGVNCFGKDVPGNVLFAHVGAFVGFSENALQLGSQWAQLVPSSGSHWDPPEDTNMIAFGFNLPTPLTRTDFCAALQGAKSGFDMHACKDCNETPDGITVVDP